jgi:FMN phosphatase YigB (HAD superfamily)
LLGIGFGVLRLGLGTEMGAQREELEEKKYIDDLEERLEQARDDVDYADPELTRLLKDALDEIRRLRKRKSK